MTSYCQLIEYSLSFAISRVKLQHKCMHRSYFFWWILYNKFENVSFFFSCLCKTKDRFCRHQGIAIKNLFPPSYRLLKLFSVKCETLTNFEAVYVDGLIAYLVFPSLQVFSKSGLASGFTSLVFTRARELQYLMQFQVQKVIDSIQILQVCAHLFFWICELSAYFC